MDRPKSRIAYFLQEILIVVIGVLIAVLIGNYKESIQDKKYIHKTLTAIKDEINLSKSEVDTVLKRHLEIVEYLSTNLENREQTLADLLIELKGIQTPSIKDISLQFFISKKAELVSFEVISQLSEIETTKKLLSEKMNRLMDFIFENITDGDTDTKIKMIYYLANVIDSEKTLLAEYSDFMEKNEAFLQQNEESK